MPSRSVKNKTRGKRKRALPAIPQLGPGQLVSNYDGRKNTNVGSFDRQAGGETPPHDRIIKWSN